MNSTPIYSRPQAGYGNGNSSMGQTGLKSFEQGSVNTSRNQTLDLSLKTREGDLVTINATSFSELEAFAYDQTGQMVNGGASSTSRFSSRTMTLETGSSFTFSVNGDLSDQELDDIEQLLGGLDRVLGKMASGDMDGAVETALGMTGYDTVSSFSADLSMEKSYTVATAVSREHYAGSQGSAPAMPSPGSSQIETLVERMMALMDEADGKIQKASHQPVDQLFAEHLRAFDRLVLNPDHGPDETDALKYEMMTDLRQRMQSLFDGFS